MRRWLAKLTIGIYLSMMFIGIGAHAINFGTGVHPVMYYFVWDMFCGWSAHEIRYHVIAEGESGQFYDVGNGPWGDFTPYGDLSRIQYDVLGNCLHKIANNTLKHTDHEPIARIMIAEEVWPKKFNLSDHLWAMRFDEPKEPHSYFWLRTVLLEDGTIVKHRPDYLAYLTTLAISSNPRLQQDSLRGKPFFSINPGYRTAANNIDNEPLVGEDLWPIAK